MRRWSFALLAFGAACNLRPVDVELRTAFPPFGRGGQGG